MVRNPIGEAHYPKVDSVPHRGSLIPLSGHSGRSLILPYRSKLHEKEDVERAFFPQRYNLPSEQERTLRAKENRLNGYSLPPDGGAASNS